MKLSLFKKIILTIATIGVVAFGGHYLFENRSQPVPIEESSNLAVGATASGLRVAHGSYVGNSTDNTDITFSPSFAGKFVYIRCDDASIASAGVISWPDLGSDLSMDIGVSNSPLSNYIQSVGTGTFQIGSDDKVNKTGVTYYYFVLGGNDADIYQYTYSGTATNPNTITGLPFAPQFFINMRVSGGAQVPQFWSRDLDRAGSFVAANPSSGLITGTSDGFTITSTTSTFNGTGTNNYKGIAFPASVAGFMKFATFTGNATDNRDITGVGFTPEVAMFKAIAGAQATVFRTATHPSDNTSISILSTANATDRIQSFSSDTIQVGANDQVNRNAVSILYWAMKDNPGTADSGNFLFLFDNF